jgi:hypothetical protein
MKKACFDIATRLRKSDSMRGAIGCALLLATLPSVMGAIEIETFTESDFDLDTGE